WCSAACPSAKARCIKPKAAARPMVLRTSPVLTSVRCRNMKSSSVAHWANAWPHSRCGSPVPDMPLKGPLHGLLLGCWLGLLLAISVPLLLGSGSIGFWLMQGIPLLLTLPGVLKLETRSLLWLAFLTLFFFVSGVLQAASATAAQRWLGLVTLLLCLSLFTAVIVLVRRGKRRKPM